MCGIFCKIKRFAAADTDNDIGCRRKLESRLRYAFNTDVADNLTVNNVYVIVAKTAAEFGSDQFLGTVAQKQSDAGQILVF